MTSKTLHTPKIRSPLHCSFQPRPRWAIRPSTVLPVSWSVVLLARQYSSILLNAAHVKTLAVSPLIAAEAARLPRISCTLL
jgi:hypothetical protein